MGAIGYVNNSNLASVLGAFRGWLLAPLFVTIGYNVSKKRIVANKILFFYSNFLLLIATFGIIEYCIDKYVTSTLPFWTNVIAIGDFITDIKGMGGTVLYGVSANFYGSYGNGWFSTKTLVSVYGNHLTYAYVMVIPCLYYFYNIIYSKKKPFIKFFIVYLSLLLSYTRIIIILVTIGILIIGILKSGWIRSLFILSIPIWIIAFVLNFDRLYSYLYDGSTMGHLNAIQYSISNINVVGFGVGSFGIYGYIGTESTFLSCIGQLGILGIILYLYFYIMCLTKSKFNNIKTIKMRKIDILNKTIVVSGIILLVTGLISEQLTAYTSIAPFYLLLGYSLHNVKVAS